MHLVFKNVNQLWSYVVVSTLKHLGLDFAVLCPGSRSTPLTLAFCQQASDIESIPILDERSGAFFALGRAKATGKPVVLVCTSGTAGANFYPAVIEAKESRVPLLLLTADRPPELRDCHSGQTIDQVKLYGNYPNWQTELATPVAEIQMLGYLRQTIIHAWKRCQFPRGGVVHLNIPFRDPLAPVADGTDFILDTGEFFRGIIPTPLPNVNYPLPLEWKKYERGIIIAGVAQPQDPEKYCQAISCLSRTLQWPVLAEGLSPVRNYADLCPYLISTYDLILRNPQLRQELTPQIIIQIGEMPTSKELRHWLVEVNAQRFVIDSSFENIDPLHGKTVHLRISVEDLDFGGVWDSMANLCLQQYLQQWCAIEAAGRKNIDDMFLKTEELTESKAAWLISQLLPANTPLFIANSMPVRDVEFFWKPNSLRIKPYFNRGANGIDGSLSTALGIAHQHHTSLGSIMLTGDLALLHDTNGFLLRNKFLGHLTIVLINNNGGGIFEMLPIANFDPPFEDFFATPQNINFADLCVTYGVDYELISSWHQLEERLRILPSQGIRVLEIPTNRKRDAQWRKQCLGKMSLL
ncbi:2-succinyl-5-enolpyruvyl-6-hydroxy-3-cyclohexene-1-carboxylic-acid synthase [Cylindrospermopsis raciborskii]|uniref:2-succinyl-5-enolpyruvyl-6-hydroxy-3- cyclohexene-1-carboxylic-acid synthase n=1 Tax=Cylindrospermopsis raciborskii TaxID=77022 RepID=UPI0038D17DD3